VNLQVKGSFLRTTIQLEFAEPELPHSIESDTPKIKDSVIRILSGKSSSELLTSEGKEKVRGEIREGVNEILGGEEVTQVYFTEFIIQ
jgi:flagellar FliL protein